MSITDSLRKYIAPSKARLPPSLLLESAEREVLFLKMKGNVQIGKRGLRVSPNTIKKDVKSGRTVVSKVLKENDTKQQMQSLHCKSLAM